MKVSITLWLWCYLVLTIVQRGTLGNAGVIPAIYPAYFPPQQRITDSLGYQPRPRVLGTSPAVRQRRGDHVAHTESREDAYSLGSKESIQDLLVESVAGEDDVVMRGGSGGTESMSVVKSETDVEDDGGLPSGNISKSVARAASSQAVHPAPLDAHHRSLALIVSGLSALAIFFAH